MPKGVSKRLRSTRVVFEGADEGLLFFSCESSRALARFLLVEGVVDDSTGCMGVAPRSKKPDLHGTEWFSGVDEERLKGFGKIDGREKKLGGSKDAS